MVEDEWAEKRYEHRATGSGVDNVHAGTGNGGNASELGHGVRWLPVNP